MLVQVCHFAQLRERAGRSEETVQIDPGTSVAALYARMFPPTDGRVLPVMFAVNQQYVTADHPLVEGDEVAFIPPLGGG